MGYLISRYKNAYILQISLFYYKSKLYKFNSRYKILYITCSFYFLYFIIIMILFIFKLYIINTILPFSV